MMSREVFVMHKNRFSKTKLLNSKWTSLQVEHKERHFMVTDLIRDESSQVITACVLQAVMTKRERRLDPDDLRDGTNWQMGWK
jgi:tryptophan-rich hypothetical protein